MFLCREFSYRGNATARPEPGPKCWSHVVSNAAFYGLPGVRTKPKPRSVETGEAGVSPRRSQRTCLLDSETTLPGALSSRWISSVWCTGAQIPAVAGAAWQCQGCNKSASRQPSRSAAMLRAHRTRTPVQLQPASCQGFKPKNRTDPRLPQRPGSAVARAYARIGSRPASPFSFASSAHPSLLRSASPTSHQATAHHPARRPPDRETETKAG